MFSRLTTGFKFFLLLVLVGGIFAAVHFFAPKSSSSSASKEPAKSGGGLSKIANVFSGNDADITIGVNTWTGFAPLVWLNNGSLEPNKESEMYKKYGIKLRIKIMDVLKDCRSAFKSGDLNLAYCTTDALPVEMGAGSGLAEMGIEQFLQVDWSRGGDLIVATRGINKVADMKGKTVAVAEGTASNTFLIATLESNGLTMNDVVLKKVADGIEAAKLFKAGAVDLAVVWTPDDGDCLAAIPGSKVLVSTKVAAYVIADGIFARKDFIAENHDLLVKFSEAWLDANATLNTNPTFRDAAAEDFAKAFNVGKDFAVNGLKNVRLTTYGDNVNFFGLNPNYQGITGEQMYSKMSIAYSAQRLANSPLAWRSVSNTSIIESISLSGSQHAAEAEIKFTQATEEVKTKEAISNKKVSVNFNTNEYNLSEDAKAIIDREFLPIAKRFALARIRIEGNTDAAGNHEANKSLSYKRAQAVANYLSKSYGFDSNRFIIVGNGSQKAIEAGVTGSSEAYRMTEFELIAE